MTTALIMGTLTCDAPAAKPGIDAGIGGVARREAPSLTTPNTPFTHGARVTLGSPRGGPRLPEEPLPCTHVRTGGGRAGAQRNRARGAADPDRSGRRQPHARPCGPTFSWTHAGRQHLGLQRDGNGVGVVATLTRPAAAGPGPSASVGRGSPRRRDPDVVGGQPSAPVEPGGQREAHAPHLHRPDRPAHHPRRPRRPHQPERPRLQLGRHPRDLRLGPAGRRRRGDPDRRRSGAETAAPSSRRWATAAYTFRVLQRSSQGQDSPPATRAFTVNTQSPAILLITAVPSLPHPERQPHLRLGGGGAGRQGGVAGDRRRRQHRPRAGGDRRRERAGGSAAAGVVPVPGAPDRRRGQLQRVALRAVRGGAGGDRHRRAEPALPQRQGPDAPAGGAAHHLAARCCAGRPARTARLYNVQIFRVAAKGRLAKIRSVFPRGNRFRLSKRRQLPRGACYVWRVWPYMGRSFTKKPLGVSNFCVRKASKR